jgi:hypothetical protein
LFAALFVKRLLEKFYDIFGLRLVRYRHQVNNDDIAGQNTLGECVGLRILVQKVK